MLPPWHKYTDISFIKRYSGFEIDLYSTFEKNNSMLEEIIQTAGIVTGVTLTAGTGYAFWLSHLQKNAEKDSPTMNSESEAFEYFDHLLSHYNLNDEQFEFRPTYHGRDYLKRHPQNDEQFIIFLNMQKGTTKARMRHELLHYVNGDVRFDYEKADSFAGKCLAVLHYAFVAEPRVIKDSKEEV